MVGGQDHSIRSPAADTERVVSTAAGVELGADLAGHLECAIEREGPRRAALLGEHPRHAGCPDRVDPAQGRAAADEREIGRASGGTAPIPSISEDSFMYGSTA